MKKTLVVILSLMLPLVWVWAAGEDAKEAVSFEQETEWQPEYGPKGDLLNPEPAVSFSKSSSGDIPDPPVIATTLLSEDFEDAAWGDPSTPPPGWTILDNGTEGTQMWYNDDWYKYYYSTWSDTTARIYYLGSAEDIYDEWLISPAIVLPGGATACSLTFKHYYNDRLQPGEDTAYVKITTDDGTTWNDVVIWDEDRTTSPYLENLDITAYDGNTVKIAFVLQANSGSYNDIYEWRIGYMDVWADAVNLLNEEFNNWGPGGGNPPSSWTIIDNGVPDTAQTDWNVNDYHDYTRWSSKTARIYYTSTYREWQDEWMISPSFSINALAAYCTLSVVEYYYHSTSTAPWGLEDHGYIKITTDAGTTWNVVYDNDVTKGSSSTKTTFKYDLMAYAGNTCQLAFHFVNSPSGSDYWNFDDVAIETLVPLDHDVATYAINAPTMGITGYDTDISVDVINLGLNTETFDDSTNMWLLNKNTLFYENFSDPQGWTGASPPVNIAGTWAVIDSGDEATPAWNNNDWHAYYYSTWTDTIARVYYYTSPYENMNEWLITPAFDMSSVTDVRLTFKQYYYDDSATETDTGWVLISSDDFAHVNVVAMYTSTQGSSSSPDYPDYDISAWAAGQSNVKIAFKYVGYSAWYWYLDNVELYEVLAPTLAYSGGE
ncbi:MAG: choice-of-anchor J domain-containing protein, partial [Candidatus Zixiibacteriota bacterium]